MGVGTQMLNSSSSSTHGSVCAYPVHCIIALQVYSNVPCQQFGIQNPSQAGCDCQGGVVFPPWQDPCRRTPWRKLGCRLLRLPVDASSCSKEVRVYPIIAAGRCSLGAFCAHVSV